MFRIEPHMANLIGFLSVVIAIVVLALNAQGAVDLSIMTGLVGVLGSFKPWSVVSDAFSDKKPKKVEVTNNETNPVPTTESNEFSANQPYDSDELPLEQRL